MEISKKPVFALALAAAIALPIAAHAATISLNFAVPPGGNDSASQTYSLSSAQTAGAPGAAAANFNNLNGTPSSNTFTGLVADNGAPTTASATVTADDTYGADTAPTTSPTPEQILFNKFLDDGSGGPITVNVNGLTPSASAGYDVYVYFASDNGARYAQYNVSGTNASGAYNQSYYANVEPNGATDTYTQVTQSTDPGGTLTNYGSGDYAVYTGLTGSSFTLTATPDAAATAAGGFPRAPIDGLQIVGVSTAAVPEPATLGIAALGMAGLALRRRRPQCV